MTGRLFVNSEWTKRNFPEMVIKRHLLRILVSGNTMIRSHVLTNVSYTSYFMDELLITL